jgi:hypothetical protein
MTEQVQTLTITGKFTHEESGYYILGKMPREVYIIHNPNPEILDALVESGKTVVIDVRIVLGDNVLIKRIDGEKYEGGNDLDSE